MKKNGLKYENKTINVLYISFGLSMGGATQSLLDMLDAVSNKINPTVIIRADWELKDYLDKRGINYYIVPSSNAYGPIGKSNVENDSFLFEDNYKAALRIVPIIEKENIHIIHSNSSVTNVGMMAALFSGRPHVWHIREYLQEDFSAEFYDEKFKMRLLNASDSIITISEGIREKYKKYYGLNSVQIYNAIKIDRYHISNDEVRIPHEIIMAGNIAMNKGQMDVVKAVKKLVNIGIGIHLSIIGGGNEQYIWAIKKYINDNGLSENVKVLPFQSDLSNYREKASVSVTASKMEGLGRVTVEAMMAGNIVVGANTGGTKEIIGEEGERGFLYKQGDVDSLVENLRSALNLTISERERIIDNAKKYVKKEFSSETYSKKLIKEYKRVLNISNQLITQRHEIVSDMKERHKYLASLDTNKINDSKLIIDKNKQIQDFVSYWNKKCNTSEGIELWLKNRNVKSIAIYGMGVLGCKLYDELDESKIIVNCVMDQNPGSLSDVVKVATREDIDKYNIDAIVICVLGQGKTIKDGYISRFFNRRIFDIEDIIGEI